MQMQTKTNIINMHLVPKKLVLNHTQSQEMLISSENRTSSLSLSIMSCLLGEKG